VIVDWLRARRENVERAERRKPAPETSA
jgi:hypothetical protein